MIGAGHLHPPRTKAAHGVIPALLIAALAAATITGCSQSQRLGSVVGADKAATLSERAVRDVLSSMDLSKGPSSDFKVDVPAFASSIVGQLPIYVDPSDPWPDPTTFHPPDTPLRQLSPAEASAKLREALAVYHAIETSSGSAAADQAIAASTGPDYGALSKADQGLIDLLGEGSIRLTFMFGEPDPTQWIWKLDGVSIVGTSTADVTYSVATPAGQPFHFTKTRFVKRLHFGKRSDGSWVLDGWLGYPAFERDVREAITPGDDIPTMVPDWWNSLGAK